MPMVGTGNNDGINVLAFQHGTIVLIDALLIHTDLAGTAIGSRQVDIAYRDHLNIITSGRPADIRRAPVSSADERYIDFVTGSCNRSTAHTWLGTMETAAPHPLGI